MPLVNSIHESLPYIDTEPSPSERAAALSLISHELGSQPSEPHPSLPPLQPSQLSPAMLAELDRVSSGQKLTAIDLSRYEALDPPTSNSNTPENLQQWKAAIAKAYTAKSYLDGRSTNLALLEKYGKNSWLIGNSQLEDILRDLERELATKKTEIDEVVIQRKAAQEAVGGEINGLEKTWKRGVGQVVETEAAAEGLRREILERRRAGAV
jgi:pre-mRNA-splicing factor SPF27